MHKGEKNNVYKRDRLSQKEKCKSITNKFKSRNFLRNRIYPTAVAAARGGTELHERSMVEKKLKFDKKWTRCPTVYSSD